MFTPFAKLLCAAAFVSAALAQGISIAFPAADATVTGGSSITVQLERPTPSDEVHEVGLVIAALACPGTCTEDYTTLGAPLYTGVFTSQSTNGAGNQFENFTVTAPNWSSGLMSLKVAHFYMTGAYGTPELEYANTTILVTGNSG